MDTRPMHEPEPQDAAPPHAASARGPIINTIEIAIIAGVIVADQLTKMAIRRMLPLHESRTIIPRLLDFTHVQNTGAAFGLLNASDFPYKSLMMIVIAAVALIAISVYARQLGAHERLSRIGLALILGGALGNLMDRAMSGYVVDFVDLYWGEAHFWAFNVADAAITFGAIFVLLDMVGLGRRDASHPI